MESLLGMASTMSDAKIKNINNQVPELSAPDEKYWVKKGSKLIVCIHDQDKKRAPITLENPPAAELKRLNKQGFGIFETVNYFSATNDDLKAVGGTKRQARFLSRLAEVYADLDVCKEEDKLPEDQREELKIKLKAEVDAHCPATYYVITKNGLHPHWQIDELSVDETIRDKYKNVERGIIEWSKKYGSKGDPVHDVTRVLRKPGFYHHKREPYLITQEPGGGKIYKLDELKKIFWCKEEKKTRNIPASTTESNNVYQSINELDIKQVVVDAWQEKGYIASFDNNDHLIIDGKVTATFRGRNGGNYMATTSSDYPAKGNAVTYVAETLKLSRQDAVGWLCKKYNIAANGDVFDELSEPISAEELDCEVFPPEVWMVHHLVPENQITIISGSSVSYKSMSALEWAIKVASGEQAYGSFNTLKSSVLYVCEDGDHRRVFQERIRFLTEKPPSNLYLWIMAGFSAGKNAVKRLLTHVEKLSIKFIILDSLRSIMTDGMDEISASDMRRLINRLRPLTAAGATVLIIHHDRKKNQFGQSYTSKDPNILGEMMSGSGDIRAAVDCHLSMRSFKDKKEDRDYIVVTQTKCREDELLPAFKILVDVEKNEAGETTKLRFIYDGEYDTATAEQTLIEARGAILGFISKSTEPHVWRDEIVRAKLGGFSPRTLEKALKAMMEDKSIASKTGKELGKKGSEARRKYYFSDINADDFN